MEGCSADLLSDAEFYELPRIRAVLPAILQSELEAASRALELSLHEPASNTPDCQPLISLLSLSARLPVGYLPEDRASSLTRKLLSWEETLTPASTCGPCGLQDACEVFAAFRSATALLLRSSGERGRASACKRAERLLETLDALGLRIPSGSSHSVPQSLFLEAVRHTADILSLLSDRERLLETVLAFGVSDAPCSAGQLVRAEVCLGVLTSLAEKGVPAHLDVAALSVWRSQGCELILRFTDAGLERSSSWPAPAALVSPLFGALGASLDLAGPETSEAAAQVSAILSRALPVLSSASADAVSVLSFVRAALRGGDDHAALQSQVLGVLLSLLNRAGWASHAEAVLATAAILFEHSSAISRASLLDALLATTQDAVALDECVSSVGELRASLQLLACALTCTAAHAEPGVRVDSERCLALALSAGDALAHSRCLVVNSEVACQTVVCVRRIPYLLCTSPLCTGESGDCAALEPQALPPPQLEHRAGAAPPHRALQRLSAPCGRMLRSILRLLRPADSRSLLAVSMPSPPLSYRAHLSRLQASGNAAMHASRRDEHSDAVDQLAALRGYDSPGQGAARLCLACRDALQDRVRQHGASPRLAVARRCVRR